MRFTTVFFTIVGVLGSTAMAAPSPNAQTGETSTSDSGAGGSGAGGFDRTQVDPRNGTLPSGNCTMEFDDGMFKCDDNDANERDDDGVNDRDDDRDDGANDGGNDMDDDTNGNSNGNSSK